MQLTAYFVKHAFILRLAKVALHPRRQFISSHWLIHSQACYYQLAMHGIGLRCVCAP